MTLSAPKQATFWIAVILWVLGLIGGFVEQIDTLLGEPGILDNGFAFWLAIIGGLVLIIGNLMEGV